MTILLVAAGLIAIAFVFSQWKAREIAQTYPNQGELTDIGGYSLNSIDIPAGPEADLPPLLFVHGASGNALDQLYAFSPLLEGRARMIFVDRPGHGYSDRGPAENDTPAGQADAIAKLMEVKGIESAIVIGHSFGGAITASLGLRHPDKVRGLVFLAAATHPWEGGVEWYYNLANTPVLGWLFCNTLAVPAGLARMDKATKSVFAPNKRPNDYVEKTAPKLVLRPQTFCNNARDVANLLPYVQKIAPHYKEITAPTVIITGDQDGIVYEEIHSVGLDRDIPDSELVWIKGIGHKPDYVATDIAIAAIEKLSGAERDLQAMGAAWKEK